MWIIYGFRCHRFLSFFLLAMCLRAPWREALLRLRPGSTMTEQVWYCISVAHKLSLIILYSGIALHSCLHGISVLIRSLSSLCYSVTWWVLHGALSGLTGSYMVGLLSMRCAFRTLFCLSRLERSLTSSALVSSFQDIMGFRKLIVV